MLSSIGIYLVATYCGNVHICTQVFTQVFVLMVSQCSLFPLKLFPHEDDIK